MIIIKGWFEEKEVAVLLDFVQIRGGEGPAQIFRSARTSCTTSGCMYTRPQEKSGSQYIQAYMPHESSEDP